MSSETDFADVVLRGQVESPTSLQRLLARIHDLTLELIEVRRISVLDDLHSLPRQDGATVSTAKHEIVLLGQPSLELELLLPGMLVWPAVDRTVIHGSFSDQSALLGALFKIHAAGYEILHVRRMRPFLCSQAACT
jgi:hypothetical protein